MVQFEKKFGFVILHYQAYEMTKECIETILNNYKSFNIHITVVDNASPNGSGNILYNEYSNNSVINVILSDKNLGFAKGNNIGYIYLKENFNPDFIIDINNDVLIDQNDFLLKISKIYEEKKFAVLGPDIYAPKLGIHQSPVSLNKFTINHAAETKKLLERQLKYYRFVYLKHKFAPLKSIFRKNMKIDKTKSYSSCVLHGACYIFSKDFINKREYAFNPCTFMYYEEYILNYEVLKLFPENKNSLYFCPQIQIKHMDDVSTNTLFKSTYKKSLWKDKQCYNSLKAFIEQNVGFENE